MITQIIILYASFAFVDILDKFLLTKRKIRPLSYAFFTVVTGALLLLAWPWAYQALPLKFIGLDLLSGAYFGLVMYVYFKTLSFGEVSRVVPVVFGLVPVFDILFSFLIHRRGLLPYESAAMCLLIPGALLMAYYPGRKFFSHFGLKILAAFLLSSYNWLWQYGARVGGSLNNLMWNRAGAAGVMLLILALPLVRKNIFTANHIPRQHSTGWLFLLKQGVGGLNFVFLSYFLARGKVPIVDGLSGFRYVFLFLSALFLSLNYGHILEERVERDAVRLKFAALALIALGTAVLFLGNL